MSHLPRLLSLVCGIATVAAFGLFAFSASADNADYAIKDAFVRSTPTQTTAGYMTVHNNTGNDDALIKADASWAERIELHQVTKDANGVMNMAEVPSMPLAANGDLVLKSGGYHLMIFGVKDTLKAGDRKTITLQFKNGGSMTQDFIVQPISYQGDNAAAHSHDANHHAHGGEHHH